MNLRNKKLINTLVAAFVVVVMAGSAFAFTSQGALIFEGTTTIDARLELAIVSGEMTGGQGLTPVGAGIVTTTFPTRTVEFTTEFDRPGSRVFFDFYVKNIGTMPANFTGVEIVTELDGAPLTPAHPEWATIWGRTGGVYHGNPFSIVGYHWHIGDIGPNSNLSHASVINNLTSVVLQPEESIRVRADVRFLHGWPNTDITELPLGHELVAEFVSRLSLQYGLHQ